MQKKSFLSRCSAMFTPLILSGVGTAIGVSLARGSEGVMLTSSLRGALGSAGGAVGALDPISAGIVLVVALCFGLLFFVRRA